MEWRWLLVAVFWCYGCAMLYYGLREYFRERTRQRNEEARPDREIILENYGFSPRECRNHHLPGDCPLCGAD